MSVSDRLDRLEAAGYRVVARLAHHSAGVLPEAIHQLSDPDGQFVCNIDLGIQDNTLHRLLNMHGCPFGDGGRS